MSGCVAQAEFGVIAEEVRLFDKLNQLDDLCSHPAVGLATPSFFRNLQAEIRSRILQARLAEEKALVSMLADLRAGNDQLEAEVGAMEDRAKTLMHICSAGIVDTVERIAPSAM